MTREESIANSREKYRKIREKQLEQIKKRKEGVAYIHENKVGYAVFEIGRRYDICVAYKWEDLKLCISLCYRSEKDQYSEKIAKGLLGNRMKNQTPGRYIELDLTKENRKSMKKEDTEKFLMGLLLANAITNDEIPEGVRRDIKSTDNAYFRIIQRV